MKEWQILEIETFDGPRWVLQKCRLDAPKPYWLTQRIYRYKVTAEKALQRAIRTRGRGI